MSSLFFWDPLIFITPQHAAAYLPTAYNTIADDFSGTRHFAWSEFDVLTEGMQADEHILDIGCGNGRLYEYLSEKNIPFTYTGIDISTNLLYIAQAKYKPYTNAFFEKKGFLDPLPKTQYHRIIAVASFHHLATHAKRVQALCNMHNALKEDGNLCMTVWNWKHQPKYQSAKKEAKERAWWNPFFTENDGIIPFGKEKIPRYYYWFSEEYIKALLAQTGFEDPEVSFSEGKKNMIIKAKKSKTIPHFTVGNVRFDVLSFDEALHILLEWATKNEGQKSVFTPNPEMIVEANTNQSFASVLSKADLSLADGNGIVWASGLHTILEKPIHWRWISGIGSLFWYFLGRTSYPKAIPAPVCGSDIVQALLQSHKGKIFLVGGAKGSAKTISQQYPKIVGIEDRMMAEVPTAELIERIKQSNANIVLVALGAPKQEMLIQMLLPSLPKVSFAMGVGGSLDFITGHQLRAPRWIRSLGLEWGYRLIHDPKRWKRIWNATGTFVIMVLSNKKL